MRTIAGILTAVLVLAALNVVVAAGPTKHADQSSVKVDLVLLSEAVSEGRYAWCELKVTNLTDKPVRFVGDLGKASLPTIIDESGQSHRTLCEVDALNCDDHREANSVLLLPGAFYGEKLHVPCLNVGPGAYDLKLTVYFRSCRDWSYAYSETVELGPVPLVVREDTK